MNKNKSSSLLLTPGPVSIPKVVLKKLSKQMIHHRDPEFTKIFLETRFLLKKIFDTKSEVLTLNSSGTGAMAAALLNTLSPQDKVLVASAGKFGDRWSEMAKAYHLNTIDLKFTQGKAIEPKKIQSCFTKHKNIKAVLVQACETSTGVLHPIKEIASLTKQKNTLLIVDAISALGATPLPMDKWGIDIMIGGSQKTFSLPAGISFIALSQKAWKFNQSAKLPIYYFNLKKENLAQQKGQTAFSSNVSYIRALHAFLKPLQNNKKALYKKSKTLSQITLKFCRHLKLPVFSKPPSPSVSVIALPQNINGVELKNQLENQGLTFGGGQGNLKGRIIRIGHLGDITPFRLKTSLRALALTLHSMDPTLIDKQKITQALK